MLSINIDKTGEQKPLVTANVNTFSSLDNSNSSYRQRSASPDNTPSRRRSSIVIEPSTLPVIHGDTTLLSKQETSESTSNKIRWAVHASLIANVILSAAKLYGVIVSGSLAVLASLVDSLLDLLSQLVLFYTERSMGMKGDSDFPAGRNRIEPIGVIICATLMCIAAVELIQQSISTLIQALAYHKLPVLSMDPLTILILLVAICVKLYLYLYCRKFRDISGVAEALTEDHRNDVWSNSMAVVSSVIAHYNAKLWYFDPAGAIIISLLILFNWIMVAREHVDKIVGRTAPAETLKEITTIAENHHKDLILDIIRAYHFGPNFLVELEVILPENMVVKDSHDISLALQQKIEQQDYVERCFVHVDFMHRDYNEHELEHMM